MLSHAAEFGDQHYAHHEHHEHHEDEGAPCSLTLMPAETDAVLPPAHNLATPHAFKAPLALTPFASQRYIYNECRAPPGRAPPAL